MGALLMVASVVILSVTLYKAFAKDVPEQVLTPVVSAFVVNILKINSSVQCYCLRKVFGSPSGS